MREEEVGKLVLRYSLVQIHQRAWWWRKHVRKEELTGQVWSITGSEGKPKPEG